MIIGIFFMRRYNDVNLFFIKSQTTHKLFLVLFLYLFYVVLTRIFSLKRRIKRTYFILYTSISYLNFYMQLIIVNRSANFTLFKLFY